MTRWEPSGLVVCQCQVMLLQYHCPERFPLAALSSAQKSMYGTASQIMLLVTSLEIVPNPPRTGCISIYCHLCESLASALRSSFCCQPLTRPWEYLSQCNTAYAKF